MAESSEQQTNPLTDVPVTEHDDTQGVSANAEAAGEARTFALSDKTSVGAIKSEIEFDPDNTPLDPLRADGRTLSGNSVGSESSNDLQEERGSSEMIIITLNTIPVEILLHICDFLEAEVVVDTLARVCQSFFKLFTNETYWRVRMTKLWPKKYPPVDCKPGQNFLFICSSFFMAY
jgi:hypothetical protein